MSTRRPTVAGAFYPASAQELKDTVLNLFGKVPENSIDSLAALIVPHAGYIYSGEVAASAFAKINRNKHYDNIFIIGPSHRKYFNGVSIFNQSAYLTPLAEVAVNQDTVSQLMKNHSFIYYDKEADDEEHSLEVQLPFLQTWLANDFKIVPLIVGSDDSVLCKRLGETLLPWFNDDNLFIISSDFSHYPPYKTAIDFDAETAEAILSNKCERLINSCDPDKRRFPEGMKTALCGLAAVQVLLNMTENNPGINFEKILYKNSGDIPYGDKNNVVGYWAISAERIN